MNSARKALFTPKSWKGGKRNRMDAPGRESGPEMFDHYKGLFRMSIRLNDSASKVLHLSLDPDNNFEISIFINKPGSAGVLLTREQYLDLLACEDTARTFFKSTDTEELEHKTTSGLYMSYSRGWVTPLLRISTKKPVAGAEVDYVALGSVTFEHMVKTKLLFSCLYARLVEYRVGVQKIYDNVKKQLAIYMPRNFDAEYVEHAMLRGLNEDEWLETSLDGFKKCDQLRAYFEIATLASKAMFKDLSAALK